ncbi:MAG: DNA polymerase III subunit gamma/tau [Janthinobacterium lividum]
MAYISLYRKYRPQTFEDVVGQEHVTTTLRNAISAGRVASGYLFTGTRGTAKTTCARILAKALNCIGPDGSLTAPTPEPCGVCGPCKSIANSSFVDVLEMDAASHGKVDDVRDLVASIKFPPMEGRYKVYIIDEAHQLSRDAMDAFLKTLEEPPDRVVFVLATTELEKLPITIASRCQVYEFKRGSVAQISARIKDVLKAEGVKADAAAVTLIARAADGSYRDSLSLLEQVLAYQRQHVTVKDVTVVLGTIDEDVLRQVVTLIADSDAAGAFGLAGSVLESGKDVRQFLKSLAERFRDMLFVGVGAKPASAGDLDDSDSLRAQSSRFAPADLLKALEVLTAAEQETKRSNQHRLILEMSLLRLMRLPSQASAYIPNPAETEVISKPVLSAEPIAAEPESVPVVPYEMPPPLAEEEQSELGEDDGDSASYALLPGDEDLDMLLLADEDDMPSLIVVSADDYAQTDDLLQVQQVAFEAPIPVPVKPIPSADSSPELLKLQKSWQEVLNLIGSRSPAGVQDVKAAKPVAVQDRSVILEFDNQFSFDRVQSKEKGRKMIEEIINRTLGVEPDTYKVKCVMAGQALPIRSASGQSPDPRLAQSMTPKPRELAAVAADVPSPFVDEVIAVFGGRLLDDDAR